VADVLVRFATIGDAVEIGPRVQDGFVKSANSEDVRTVPEIVLYTFETGTQAWAAEVNGALVAIWGVSPLSVLTGVGYPWLFLARDIPVRASTVSTVARWAMREMMKIYPRLLGGVDNEFLASVRFAKHLGFKVTPTKDARFSSIELTN